MVFLEQSRFLRTHACRTVSFLRTIGPNLGRSWDYCKLSGTIGTFSSGVKYLNHGAFPPSMFGLFGTAQRIEEMDKSVADSFAKVRQDTQTLYQWVQFLYQQNQQMREQNAALRRLCDEQKLSVNELKIMLAHMPRTPEQIKAIIDTHYSLEPVVQRIKHMEQKLEILELRKQPRTILHEVPIQAPQEEESSLKERLMKKLVRNSKEYIKNLVLSLVHKYGKVGALQLREIVVEEQGLCSKSSFYRILEEMEEEQKLQEISDGKHTIYVANTPQEHQV